MFANWNISADGGKHQLFLLVNQNWCRPGPQDLILCVLSAANYQQFVLSATSRHQICTCTRSWGQPNNICFATLCWGRENNDIFGLHILHGFLRVGYPTLNLDIKPLPYPKPTRSKKNPSCYSLVLRLIGCREHKRRWVVCVCVIVSDCFMNSTD